MSKRKYSNFIVEFEGDDIFETSSWRDAFSIYNHYDGVCSVYGLPEYDGANYEFIMGKE